jgi:hypothetical protein
MSRTFGPPCMSWAKPDFALDCIRGVLRSHKAGGE